MILNFIYRSEILLHISFESKYCNDCNPVALSLDVTRAQQVDTRYSTQTQKFWSYSNLTRTKHYSDRVVSSINSRNFRIISTIIQKQPARRYFRIITANPDIQMQPSMEKMSSDLNVKKMEDVSKLYKLYFKNYMTHKFISSCPCSSATSSLSGR